MKSLFGDNEMVGNPSVAFVHARHPGLVRTRRLTWLFLALARLVARTHASFIHSPYQRSILNQVGEQSATRARYSSNPETLKPMELASENSRRERWLWLSVRESEK